jgi:hypothetical protein
MINVIIIAGASVIALLAIAIVFGLAMRDTFRKIDDNSRDY